MVWLLKRVFAAIAKLARKIECSARGHVVDLPNKRCSRCLEPAPMCEWCGERLASMATRGGKVEHVCRECVGV